MKIDCFTHIMPPRFFEALQAATTGPDYLSGMLQGLPDLADMENRIRIMDELGVDKQVLTISSPPIEIAVPHPGTAARLATLANDQIAEATARHADRFIAVGTVAMNAPDTMAREAERCLDDLGMRGMLIYSSAAGRPIDGPEFEDFYTLMAERDYPIWLHPARGGNRPDYVGEEESKYWIWQVFGWPFETTAAMTRLVFNGIFDRLPELKIITHHAGAMAPFFSKRIEHVYDHPALPELRAAAAKLQRKPSDYFRMFYNDTALMGSTAGLSAAYAYFGAERLLFGTDTPFDGAGGAVFGEETLFSVEALPIPPRERELIFAGNAQRLLKIN